MTHSAPTTVSEKNPDPASADNRVDLIGPDAPNLAARGPYPVGVRTLRFTNPGQIDILATTPDAAPRHDRPLTAEVWYPATAGTRPGGTYRAGLRDGITQVTLHGRAARDAAPAADAHFPLVVISHGFPGNRFLMSHLGESLASRGYVVAAADHTDSTYSDYTDPAAFASTLLNRPLDQRFMIDAMATLPGPLGAITDTSAVAVIGYSMGGYGALVFGGAGVTSAALDHPRSAAQQLRRHLAGSATHRALVDERVRALIAIAPWGREAGFWDAPGLAGITKPLMIFAGGADAVAAYAATRRIFAETTGTRRHLLTFKGAGHNAAAPIPAPRESWAPSPALDFAPCEHYADPVWDSTTMNNIAQHFAAAFLDIHLKGDTSRSAFLDIPDAPNPWPGFAPGAATGLTFETLNPGT